MITSCKSHLTYSNVTRLNSFDLSWMTLKYAACAASSSTFIFWGNCIRINNNDNTTFSIHACRGLSLHSTVLQHSDFDNPLLLTVTL